MRNIFQICTLVFILIAAGCANLSGEPPIVATILPATQLPPTDVPPQDEGFPAQAPDMANGAALYAANCAACHGDTGRGNGPVAIANPDMKAGNFKLPNGPRAQTPQQWFNIITDGRIENLMPPWGNTLTEQERWDVALYTYTMHYTPDMLSIGEQIYSDCAECHGDLGGGDGPDAAASLVEVKNLSDPRGMSQLSDESIFNMVTQGFDDVMPSYAHLSDEERLAVAAYARTLSLDRSGIIVQPTRTPAPDTTGDEANLVGTALLLQIHAIGDALEIVQALRLYNTSETLTFNAYIPVEEGTAALSLTLPDGAMLSSLTNIDAMADDGRTVYSYTPILPQSEQLYVIAYTLPYTLGDPVNIPLDIAIAAPVRVLIRPLEAEVNSAQLQLMGQQTLGEQEYAAYGSDLVFEANSTLSFSISGTPDAASVVPPAQTPQPAAQSTGGEGIVTADVLLPLTAAALLLLVGGLVVFALRTRTISPEKRIMQIAREIGVIDAAHQAGTLNHDLWHRQRAALKAEQMRLRGFPEDKSE